jgi:serine/threonine protein kinase/tetratricopeptide (TPR) repeat protein
MNEKTRYFYCFGPFRLDPGECLLILDGKSVPLAPKAFEVLLVLVENAGRLVDKDDLMKRLWPGTFVEEANVAKHVSLLRRILSEATNGREYIETVPKRGYRFVVEVKKVAEPEAGSQPQAIPGANLTGKKVSHYRVLEVLGGGGMGVVYKAEDLKLGRFVALKFLPEEIASDAKVLERFEREARAASALDHPNICAIHEFGEHEGRPFIAMSLLQGQNLRERIAAKADPFTTDELLNLAIQIAEGLAAAHEKGIIHRDIKPANIFITQRGEAKILDFGLAKMTYGGDREDLQRHEGQSQDATTAMALDIRLSLTGVTMGTVPYMSPEQVRGEKLDARTDLFSFGVVLYEMATGQQAFSGDTAATLHEAILNRTAVPARELNPELPPKAEEIINKALEKDRNLRYQHVTDMRTDLQRLKRDSESGRNSASSSGPVLAAEPLPAPFKKVWKIVVPLVLVALLVGGGFYYRWHQRKRLTDKDTIVLTDFANSTADAIFDDTLKTALTVSLRQSPFLNVLSDAKVTETLRLMTLPPSTKLAPDVARELCQRAGSKAYIAGAIGSLGSKYVLELKAVNCQSGDTLAEDQVTAASKEKVLDTLGEAASKLRGELGESLATVKRFDVPLYEATTSSLEALKAYSLGRKAVNEKGSAAGLPYHQRAIELDPNFAIGYLAVGGDYSSIGELGRASEYYTKAFQLRERASEREKLGIAGSYYRIVTGELEKAAQTYQEETESFPQNSRAYNNSGVALASLGEYEKATEVERQGLRLAPEQVVFYANLANCFISLQRLDETRQMIHEAQARKLDNVTLHNALYALAFLGADSAAMAEQQQWYASKPAYESVGLALASDTEAYSGHVSKARELTKRAVESAIRTDSKETGAIWQANAALQQAAYGNTTEARQSAGEALKLAPTSQGGEVEAVLAFAMAGDTTRAESIAQDLGKRFPLNTQMQSLWLPAIQAQLALDKKNPASALGIPQAGSPLEFGLVDFALPISCLYPLYVQGEAYLADGQGNAAATEFQKIIDHSGIVWNCWTGALAHLGVARANALESRTSQGADADAARVRALAAYNDFLALWKDADPDIPILKQAKAEYGKLQ